MNLVSWNCQGLGNPKAVRALHSMVKSKGPKVLFLMETKLSSRRMEDIRTKVGFDYAFTVPSVGQSGGLALLWKQKVDVRIQNFSQHHIDAHMDSIQLQCWRFTGFYGRLEQHRRRESWALLKHLNSLDSLPWLCIGDFNEILATSEKSGGQDQSIRQILDFQETVNSCAFIDLGYQVARYTWNNNRDDEANIQRRLDRALATLSWLDFIPMYTVTHCPSSISDHLALVIDIAPTARPRRRQKAVRRFEEKWATLSACEEVIRSSWQKHTSEGSPMYRLCQKLSRCRMALMDWSREDFGDLSTRIQHKLTAIEALHTDNYRGQHNPQLRLLREEVNLLLHQDELHWRQRSREVWLAAGDKNTKFFHQQAKQRRGKNTIKCIFDSNGTWCVEEGRMGEVAV
jgi:hypothetical protein